VTNRSNLRRLGVLILTALLPFALVSCTDDGTPDLRSGNNQAFIEGDGTVTVIDPADREPAPELSGTTLQGEELSTSEFDGDVVVLNVWASWCGPCRAEADALNEVAVESAGKGVQFIGLNNDTSDVNALAFEENFEVTYPSLFDPNGQLQLLFSGVLPPAAVPSTLVVDSEGNIAARILGATNYDQLSKLVRDVKAESSQPA
jgi:thiol-disulfide isomerase/thioredoxin